MSPCATEEAARLPVAPMMDWSGVTVNGINFRYLEIKTLESHSKVIRLCRS